GLTSLSAAFCQSALDCTPIDICEERFDIFRALGGLIVQQERMLPNIHDEYWSEARYVSCFVQCDPMIREPVVCRVLVTYGPSNSTHLADPDKISFPDFVATETGFGILHKLGRAVRITSAHTLFQVLKIILVQDHAVIFETESPR